MSERLDRIGAERDRAREKRDQWDARYRELSQKYIQQENTEIHEMVRAQNMTPGQLAEVLEALRGGQMPSPAIVPGAGAPDRTDGCKHSRAESKEDKKDED